MSQPGPFGRRNDAPPHEPEPPEPPEAIEAHAPPEAPAPSRPSARGSNLAWVLGVVCVLGIGSVTLDALRSGTPGSQGVRVGDRLPPFAAPLASSTRRCDGGGLCNANLARAAEDDVRRAACEVRLPDVLNVCALAERGPVALAFVAGRSERCRVQVDVMERVRRRFPGVGLAAVSVRGDRAELRETIRARGWTLPVAHDPDGAVANAYGAAVCPTLTFARRGGRVQSTSLEALDERALGARLRALGG